jgi:hypothetical protein
MFGVLVKSVALLFEPLDTSGSNAGTQSAHTCGGDVDLVWDLHAATDLKSQCHLPAMSEGAIKYPLNRAACSSIIFSLLAPFSLFAKLSER